MLTSIEGASLKIKERNVIFSIPKKSTMIDSVTELDELLDQEDLYVDCINISEDKKSYLFHYEIPEGCKSFHSAKKSNLILRLSLIDKLLLEDPLKDHYTILHPQNIYYFDMRNIIILYRGTDRLLTCNNLSNLEQYKLIAITMLSDYSYEVIKKRKISILSKEKNELLNKIEHAQDLHTLSHIIYAELNMQEAAYFEKHADIKKPTIKQNNGNKFIPIIATAVIVLLASSLFFTSANASNVIEAKYKAREAAYKNVLFDNIDTALQYVDDCEFNDIEMLDWYYVSGQYDLLLQKNGEFAANVVDKLIRNNEYKKVLDIDLKKENSLLTMEKALINDDASYIEANYSSVKNDQQLARIIEYYLAKEDTTKALMINSMISDDALRAEMQRKIR